MRKSLPSLTALLCFDAAARHLNFTRAGEELNLTQSAVSRQIRKLEDYLGKALFRRAGKSLHLTDEGQAYAKGIMTHLNGLEAETLKLLSDDAADMRLNVGTFPTFGSHWLIPRLPDFTRQYPDIQLNLTTGTRPFDFASGDIDVAIQHGKGDWPGVDATLLIEEQVVAVCAPSLLQDQQRPAPADLLKHRLLNLQTRLYAWPDYLTAKGLDTNKAIPGPTFETFSMMIRAARSGLGIAIVPTLFVQEELNSGHLIAPFGEAIASGRGYYVTTSPAKRRIKRIDHFIQWVTSAAT